MLVRKCSINGDHSCDEFFMESFTRGL
uniref:Uncharacterized protein n=1 Tax=Anguilla anguilla TaxID=7936 RepID=A0A0E9VKU9_ANGAN